MEADAVSGATGPLSVLQVTDPTTATGGVEVHVDRLSEALRERGHRVEQWRVEPHRGLAAALDLWDPVTRHRLRSFADGFDVVHIHNFLRTLSPSVISAPTPPVVVTVHDHRLVRREARHDEREGVTRYAIDAFQGAQRRLAHHAIRSHAAATIAVSEELTHRLRAVSIDSDVIPPFLDLPCVDLPTARVEATGVLFVGRIAASKGIWWLLDAMRAVWHHAEGAGRPKPTLSILGDGPDRPALTRVARDEGLPIEPHGAVDEQHVRTAMAAAAVVCIPSIEPEGMPLVALEAMAAGAAVVASDLASLRSLCDDGRGIVVPRGDVLALARALETAIASPATTGRVARAWAAAHVATDVVVPRIEAIYHRVAASS